MIENQIGNRYAEALSNSLSDNGGLTTALESLKDIAEAFETDPQLGRFFTHPAIPVDKKNALAKEIGGKVKAGQEILNLLRLLVNRQKINYVKNIAEYFEKYVSERLNQVRVNVVSAYPLTNGQIEKLKTSLDRILGKSAIIEASVDESLIGGVRLSVGSLVADATLKNRLALLKRSLEKEEALGEFASG
jgi:F-type H+-transporting ATPase subunit delta